ncbi:MAG: NADH-quinone oxidoreductase subunit L [Leptospirillum sp.]|jgi:NAD(P)H-quinone oxidoreductase subunit 5|nr:NADH-quinone oxidoreductase subunit L [Nitrospiraceae bacterium]
MTLNEDIITSALMLIAPWPLLGVGTLLGIRANNHKSLIKKASLASAIFALVTSLLAALSYTMTNHAPATFLSIGLPGNMGNFSIDTSVTPLTIIMLVLVAFVGTIVSRYSFRYMDGDRNEGVFHRWLSLTLGSFFTLIAVGNIWAFLVSWVATSLFLHNLLTFYKERPIALMAAGKKYLFSRISDLTLLIAFILIVQTIHATEFSAIKIALLNLQGPLPGSLIAAGYLIVASAIFKSAQFPFHGWLIQVMEAPTPVSALLHAGIIYTGAFLLLRMSPLLSVVSGGRDLLIVFGALTILTTSLMMLTETNIKESLAYSTSAQMGFMLMECGMGLYSLAVIHILGHSVYKAHAFLSSGSVVDHFRTPSLKPEDTRPSGLEFIPGLLFGITMTLVIAKAFGMSFREQPALLTIGTILSVAVSQLMLPAMRSKHPGKGILILWIAGISTLVLSGYFGLHQIFSQMLGKSLPSPRFPEDTLEVVLGFMVSATFLLIYILQARLASLGASPFWNAMYVHLYNGLYVDIVINRLVRRLGFEKSSNAADAPALNHTEEIL